MDKLEAQHRRTHRIIQQAYRQAELEPSEEAQLFDAGDWTKQSIIEAELGWPHGTIAAIAVAPALKDLSGIELAAASLVHQMDLRLQGALLEMMKMALVKTQSDFTGGRLELHTAMGITSD